VLLVKGTRAQAEALKEQIATLLATELKLTLSRAKTLVTHINDGFDFLGFRIQRKARGGKGQIYTFPSPKAFAAVKRAVKALTRRSTTSLPLRGLLAQLNPILRGWTNYFRYAPSKRTFAYLDQLLPLRAQQADLRLPGPLRLVAGGALAVEEAQTAILETVAPTRVEAWGDWRRWAYAFPPRTGTGRALSLSWQDPLTMGISVTDAAHARDSDRSTNDCGHGEPGALNRRMPGSEGGARKRVGPKGRHRASLRPLPSEHVWTVAKELHGEDTPETKAWARAALDRLWQRGPEPLLEWFDATQPGTTAAAAGLKRERSYFSSNASRMQYPALREQHLPIGSGAVEASAKHLVQQRMKRAGARWSDLGARAILDLRCHLLSGRSLDSVA
jgi:Group II intron, maturase-specific domain